MIVWFALISLAISPQAFAQAFGQGGMDPTAVSAPPRALALGQDPFASVNFSLCLQATGGGAGKYDALLKNTLDVLVDKKKPRILTCDESLESIVPNSCGVFEKSATPKPGDETSEKKSFDGKAEGKLAKELKSRFDCKQDRARQAKAAAECFGKQFEVLKNAMAEVKKDFDENIKEKNKYLSAIDSEVEKETAKKKSLDSKTEKFGQTMQEIEQVLGISGGGGKDSSGSSKLISQFKIGVAEHKLKLQQFERMKVKTRSNRALMCVKSDPLPPFSQIRNCYEPTIYRCMVENYFRERQLHYSGGSTRVSPADRRKAEIDKARFEDTISKLFGDFASGEKTTPTFTSYDSLMSRYGPRLEAFGASGKMLRSELARCYNNSGEQMEKELADPTSELYKFGFEAKKNGEQLSAEMGDVINKLDKAIRNAGSAVFQSELNELVNGHGCNTRAVMNTTAGKVTFQTQALETQLECAQGLNENLYALLNGTPPPGSTLPILATLGKGADGKEQFCKGLRDCFDKSKKLASASESRITQLKGKSTFADTACKGGQCPGREKAIIDSNRNIENAFRQGADAFKSRVTLAKSMLDQVKQMFSKAGIEFPTIDESKPRPFSCKGEQQICELPDPFDDAMAAAAGLPLMKSSDFSAAAKAAKAELDTEKKDYEKAKGDLEAMAEKCKKQIKEEEKERKQTDLNKKKSELDRKLRQCSKDVQTAVQKRASDVDDKIKSLSNKIKENEDNIKLLDQKQLFTPQACVGDATHASCAQQIQALKVINQGLDDQIKDILRGMPESTDLGALKSISSSLEKLVNDFDAICSGDPSCQGMSEDLKSESDIEACGKLNELELKLKDTYDKKAVSKAIEDAKTVK